MEQCGKRSGNLVCVADAGHKARHKFRVPSARVEQESEPKPVSEKTVVSERVRAAKPGLETFVAAHSIAEQLLPLTPEQRKRVLSVVTQLLDE